MQLENKILKSIIVGYGLIQEKHVNNLIYYVYNKAF